MRGEIDQDSRVLSELSAMIINILRYPPLPISFASLLGPAVSSLSYRTSQASPSAFASLFLGISVSLMLFGSLTFVIGLFLMPFVVGLVMLFYFVGMIHKLSELGRNILWPGYTPYKDVPGPEYFSMYRGNLWILLPVLCFQYPVYYLWRLGHYYKQLCWYTCLEIFVKPNYLTEECQKVFNFEITKGK